MWEVCDYVALSNLSRALPRFMSLPSLGSRPFHLHHLAGSQCASVTNPVCSGKLTSVFPCIGQVRSHLNLYGFSFHSSLTYLGHGPGQCWPRRYQKFSWQLAENDNTGMCWSHVTVVSFSSSQIMNWVTACCRLLWLVK